MKALFQPLLPRHYSIWFEPPDETGDEVLHMVSGRRSLRLKGRAFREFHRHLLPLLNGRHTVDQIHDATSNLFKREDLEACLKLLLTQGVIVDGAAEGSPPERTVRREPQLNLFHDLAPGEDLQQKLAQATVAVVGLSGAGAEVAVALANAGVGTLRCIDHLPVEPADTYLSPLLALGQAGETRATVVAAAIHRVAPDITAVAWNEKLESEAALRLAIAGANFVVCCLDAAQANLIFKLNRVCLADDVRWIACSLGGAEIAVGPGMHPGRGPCFLCYRMRSVACAGNPEEAFAYEKYLDRRRRDDSARRENLVFGAGLAANLLGLEVVKVLTGLAAPSLTGRLLTVRLTDLVFEHHTVLRKPSCPACSSPSNARHGN